MSKPIQIQILKKGDRYIVRSKGLFGLWRYWSLNSSSLWPARHDWADEEHARRQAAQLRQWDDRERAFKAAPIEVLPD